VKFGQFQISPGMEKDLNHHKLGAEFPLVKRKVPSYGTRFSSFPT